MNLNLRELRKNRVFLNAVTLYAVQACTYVLPMLTFPYLSRVLKPAGWGAVLFANSIGLFIVIFVEYGFDLSATREAARFANDKARLRELVSGVLGAKLTLGLLGVLGALIARPFTMRVAPSPALFWASTLWGVGQGVNMLWYFQGLQRMKWAGGLDITGRIIATISIFALVHKPEDGWKVMAAQAVGSTVAHAITVVTAYREVGFCWPRFHLVWQALRLGWPMFLFRASQSLLGSSNGLILGFFDSPAAVGLFGGADKIRQVANQAVWPISQAIFPHQAQQVQGDPASGVRLVRRSLLYLGGLGTALGLVVLFTAPLIVRIVLGSAFLPAVPALRIFSLVIPLSTVTGILAFQWLLPLGFDKGFNIVVLSTGILNVVLGILLVSKFGVTGMAVAVTVAEIYNVIGFDMVVRLKGLSPFSRIKTPTLENVGVPTP
jgi:polysaccharide transporter, PST family